MYVRQQQIPKNIEYQYRYRYHNLHNSNTSDMSPFRFSDFSIILKSCILIVFKSFLMKSNCWLLSSVKNKPYLLNGFFAVSTFFFNCFSLATSNTLLISLLVPFFQQMPAVSFLAALSIEVASSPSFLSFCIRSLASWSYQ